MARTSFADLRKKIDARDADAQGLRLWNVTRDMSGNIVKGRDSLTGGEVNVPAVDNLAPPPMSAGFAKLRAQTPVTYEEREAGRLDRERAIRDKQTPGFAALRQQASAAGESTANNLMPAVGALGGGAGELAATAAGAGLRG